MPSLINPHSGEILRRNQLMSLPVNCNKKVTALTKMYRTRKAMLNKLTVSGIIVTLYWCLQYNSIDNQRHSSVLC